MRRTLLIFAKFPTPGRVKTRLAKGIGPVAAAEAYKLLVARVIRQVQDAPLDTLRIMFDPAEKAQEVRDWLTPLLETAEKSGKAIEFTPQSDGDLGERLSTAIKQAFSDGYTAAAAIGTDCIELNSAHLAQAWDALENGSDAVFGPAGDGGYYLVALSKHLPQLFVDIPWSAEDTLEKSLARARKAGIEVAQLETLDDIDEIGDWERVKGAL